MPKSYLIDMDGVIVRGNELIPGADDFIERLHQREIKFLILTNNLMYTPTDLQHRLQRLGVHVTPDHIYTSAQATSAFLHTQKPNGTAFVLGESGLIEALHQVGYVLTDHQPDYVVLGKTMCYSYARITQAVHLITAGARFIATNPDPSGPEEGGLVPACGAIAALVETATGVEPYFIGKAQPLDDANCVTLLGRTLGERDHGWGPNGYRYSGGDRKRDGNGAGVNGSDHA